MNQEVFRFTKGLVVILLCSFLVQASILYVLNQNIFGNLLIWTYVVNSLIAFGLFVLLEKQARKMSGNLGFLFMGGSLVKFLLFFLVFYPTYNEDGEMDKWEFFAFFIPYMVSLFWEINSLVKRLNKG